jgi:hypothetical protein
MKFSIKSMLVFMAMVALSITVAPAIGDVVSYYRFHRSNAALQIKAIKVNAAAGRETKPDIYETVYGKGPSDGLLDK